MYIKLFLHAGPQSCSKSSFAYLLLEPGDIAVKVDAVLPSPVGVLANPLGQLSEVLPLLGLQVSLKQQLSMKGSLKILQANSPHMVFAAPGPHALTMSTDEVPTAKVGNPSLL